MQDGCSMEQGKKHSMHSLEIHGRLDRNSSTKIYSLGERELTANS